MTGSESPNDPFPTTRVTVQRLDAPQAPVASFVGPSFLPPAAPIDRTREFRRMLHVLTPRVFVTYLLLAANVLLFVWMVLHGVKLFNPTIESLLKYGADYGPYTTAQGQWWRTLTATFIHIGLIHLLMNMYVLWAIGPFVERLLGNVGFAVAYLVSGLAGSIASLWHNPMVVGAGASGAIFGLFGALAGFVILRRDSIPQQSLRGLVRSVLIFVGYNVLYGMTSRQIDMAAHLGGLTGGLVCGLLLSQPLTLAAIAGRRLRNAMTLFVGLGAVALLASQLPRDYFKEMFGRMQRIENRAQPLLRQSDEGKISDADFAAAMRRNILPDWLKVRSDVALMMVSRERASQKALLENYMKVREAEWELEAQIAADKIKDPRVLAVRLLLRADADEKQRQLKSMGPG